MKVDKGVPTYVFDLEETISNSEHRENLPTLGKFDDYRKEFVNDTIVLPMLHLIEAVHRVDTAVLILTAKPDSDINDVVEWLEKYQVPYDSIWMRPTGNMQPSPELKLDMLQEIKEQVRFVIDDRQDVVDYLNQNGIPSIQFNLRG